MLNDDQAVNFHLWYYQAICQCYWFLYVELYRTGRVGKGAGRGRRLLARAVTESLRNIFGGSLQIRQEFHELLHIAQRFDRSESQSRLDLAHYVPYRHRDSNGSTNRFAVAGGIAQTPYFI